MYNKCVNANCALSCYEIKAGTITMGRQDSKNAPRQENVFVSIQLTDQ